MITDTLVDDYRRSLRFAQLNGGIWGIGNGLVSTTLIRYLSQELGAEGLAIGLIIASPNFFGILRLFAPNILSLVGSRKRMAIGLLLISSLLLVALPLLAWPGVLPSPGISLFALINLWGLWHLTMFLGVIALYSWIGDLSRGSGQSKFFGERQTWLVGGQVIGMFTAALLVALSQSLFPEISRWQQHVAPAILGGLLMLISVLPVLRMTSTPAPTIKTSIAPDFLTPLRDPRYQPLILFWCFAGIANGAAASAVGLYPIVVAKLPASFALSFEATMLLSQAIIAPFLGRFMDRFGSRVPMMLSQVIVSVALVFYLIATKEQNYWIGGAYFCWIGYVGLNVGLYQAMVSLSPNGNSPLYISTFLALGGLCNAISSASFGAIFDLLPRGAEPLLTVGSISLDRFQLFIVGGIMCRLLTTGFLWRLPKETGITIRPQPEATKLASASA